MTEVLHPFLLFFHSELQPLPGEQLDNATANTQDGVRLDIAAYGLWEGRHERTFFDVRIFNPYAPLTEKARYPLVIKKQEKIKRRVYVQRVREVEHASFTPLALSATGGMANESTHFYKRLASLLAMKWNQPYSSTTSRLRCRVAFSLLRSAI